MYGRYELYLGHKNHHVKGFSENEVVSYILMKMRLCVLSDYARVCLCKIVFFTELHPLAIKRTQNLLYVN